MRFGVSTGCVLGLALALSACGDPGGGGGNACGFSGDPEGNETRDTATPLDLGSTVQGCMASADDADWYELVVPETPAAGGVVKLSVTDVGGQTTAGLVVSTASDNGTLLDEHGGLDGQPVHVYFAAAPGQRYRALVQSRFTFKAPGRYTLTASYAPVGDVHEPNDTRQQATPFEVGTVMSGYLTAGFKQQSQPVDVEHADWYTVGLAPDLGATFTVANVPLNLRADFELFDGLGNSLHQAVSSSYGATISYGRPSATTPGGVYFIRVMKRFAYADQGPAGKGEQLPDNFTRAYQLTVTQP